MVESDRLTIAFAAAADRAGAELANYAEAIEALKRRRPRRRHARARRAHRTRRSTVRARVTLNAAGSRGGDVMAMFGVARPFPLLKAMNLVTSKPASDMALAAPARGGPHADARAVARPRDRRHEPVGDASSSRATPAWRPRKSTRFIADANDAFPALHLTPPTSRSSTAASSPPSSGGTDVPDLKPSHDILDHAADGIAGAVTVIGVEVHDRAGRCRERSRVSSPRRLGRRVPPSRTATTTLPGAGIADHEALAIEAARGIGFEVPLPDDPAPHRLYADAAPHIIRLMHAACLTSADPSAPASPTLGAEVVHVIRHEMALRLADIVVRRTGLGSARRPPDDAVAECARIAAAELGWDATRDRRRRSPRSGGYMKSGIRDRD